jgi:hypothetical protein
MTLLIFASWHRYKQQGEQPNEHRGREADEKPWPAHGVLFVHVLVCSNISISSRRMTQPFWMRFAMSLRVAMS